MLYSNIINSTDEDYFFYRKTSDSNHHIEYMNLCKPIDLSVSNKDQEILFMDCPLFIIKEKPTNTLEQYIESIEFNLQEIEIDKMCLNLSLQTLAEDWNCQEDDWWSEI